MAGFGVVDFDSAHVVPFEMQRIAAAVAVAPAAVVTANCTLNC